MSNSWFTALFFIALGAATFWVWHKLDEEAAKAVASRPHEPDYYLMDMVRSTMGKDGALQSVLRADTMFHYPDDDTAELARPRMEIYNEDARPWYVVAERATVKSGNEVVLLHGIVEIWRVDDAGQRELEVITSELRVFPRVQYAETDDPATITSPTSVTKSIGFRANFEHDRLELLERVKSRHETKSRS
jgi:lipopolysaccharide export system protein LptC